jgi:hypothetical protein
LNQASSGSKSDKRHSGSHEQSDNVTVSVSNNVNNYVASTPTTGTINASVIQNTISNNVNVNTKATNSPPPSGVPDWMAAMQMNMQAAPAYASSQWANQARSSTTSDKSGHRRLSGSTVQGLLNEMFERQAN